MIAYKTTDLCDRYDHEIGRNLRVLAPVFQSYGGRRAFFGHITTLRLFEDNSLVREALTAAGQGRVLVVDGGGSLRCALLGDQLAALAVKNEWSGVVINGCIRDSQAIATMDLGVRALATHPQRSVKRGIGDHDVPVTFGGIRIETGEWLYADEDGIVVSREELDLSV